MSLESDSKGAVIEMAQTTKKKTVTVKDLNVVVTKLTSDMVMLSNCVLEMVEKVNTMDNEAETSELVTLLKDLDGKVTAINEDVDTRDKIKHLEQKVAALVTENRAKEKNWKNLA